MSPIQWKILYTWIALPLLWVVSKILSLKNEKMKKSIDGKKGSVLRIGEGMIHQNLRKPLVWFHVASVGEYLQALPIMERCFDHDMECVVTFNSISGYEWAKKSKFPEGQEPLAIDYLPFDFPGSMKYLLAVLQPAAVVYAKFDLWPNLIWEARAQSIPQFLVSATLHHKSLRLTSALMRSFYGTVYACLDGIFAVSEADADRFRMSSPRHPNIQILGDTRLESVLDRKKQLPQPNLPVQFHEKFVMVLGSIWPKDEEQIFPALSEALDQFPDLHLIIAPHEPTEEHLATGEAHFKSHAMGRLTQLEQVETKDLRVVMVDTVGVLSSLYFAGNLAYVGGAFTTGVHNILEPSVMGMPVIFGPRHHNAPEAFELLGHGFAFAIENTHDFRKILFDLLNDRTKCATLGQASATAIEAQSGAADRCFQSILEKVQ